MNGRELVLGIFVVAAGAALVMFLMHLLQRGNPLRARRASALLDALQDPGLDAVTRAELLRALARDHVGLVGKLLGMLQQPIVWRAIWFGIGWFVFVLSGAILAMCVLGVLDGTHATPMFGVFTAIGFAMVSMPMAWREMRRRAPANEVT